MHGLHEQPKSSDFILLFLKFQINNLQAKQENFKS